MFSDFSHYYFFIHSYNIRLFSLRIKTKPAKQNILKSQLIGNKIPNVIIQQADNNLITNDKELNFEKYKNRVFAVNFLPLGVLLVG